MRMGLGWGMWLDLDIDQGNNSNNKKGAWLMNQGRSLNQLRQQVKQSEEGLIEELGLILKSTKEVVQIVRRGSDLRNWAWSLKSAKAILWTSYKGPTWGIGLDFEIESRQQLKQWEGGEIEESGPILRNRVCYHSNSCLGGKVLSSLGEPRGNS